MIIENKSSTGFQLAYSDRSVVAICEDGNFTKVFLHGVESFFIVEKKYEDVKKEFMDAHDRDPFYQGAQAQTKIKVFPTITVDKSVFCLQSIAYDHDQEERKYIKLIANFPVKNDLLKILIEEVVGVESYNEYGFHKYECTISIGRLFDPESIIPVIEEKIKDFLL